MAESTAQGVREPYGDELFCPECGYSLRGISSPRCPECGLSLDFIESAESTIPWVHRRTRGRIKTYCQTAWQVLVHTKRFCREAYRPVSLCDAQRFRWVSILIGFGTLLLPLPLAAMHGNTPLSDFSPLGWWFHPLSYGCALLALSAFTVLPADCYRSQRAPAALNDRAATLSLYASAVLTGTWIPILALFAAGFFLERSDPLATVALLSGVILVPVGLLIWW